LAFAGAFSHHDRYFFRRREEMVAGSVRTPFLDLKNEALLRAHVHAEWLAATGLALRDSVETLIDTNQGDLPLFPEVQDQLRLTSQAQENLLQRLRRVFADDWEYLSATGWFGEDWLRKVVEGAPQAFDRAFDTWRELYRSAMTLHAEGLKRSDPRNPPAEREEGLRLIREAQRQMDLLLQRDVAREEGDFYPYRYLASEEFLPGYNLMALPVRAFVPRKEGEYVSRPRTLAITEFAPGNVLYHQGGEWTARRLLSPPGGLKSRFRELWGCSRCGHVAPPRAEVCPQCGASLDGNNLRKRRWWTWWASPCRPRCG